MRPCGDLHKLNEWIIFVKAKLKVPQKVGHACAPACAKNSSKRAERRKTASVRGRAERQPVLKVSDSDQGTVLHQKENRRGIRA